MRLTRDSWLLTLSILGAALAYCAAAPPPTEWTYPEYIKAIAFLVATVSGKLATSPLRGDKG